MNNKRRGRLINIEIKKSAMNNRQKIALFVDRAEFARGIRRWAGSNGNNS